eukprot:363306_1
MLSSFATKLNEYMSVSNVESSLVWKLGSTIQHQHYTNILLNDAICNITNPLNNQTVLNLSKLHKSLPPPFDQKRQHPSEELLVHCFFANLNQFAEVGLLQP